MDSWGIERHYLRRPLRCRYPKTEGRFRGYLAPSTCGRMRPEIFLGMRFWERDIQNEWTAATCCVGLNSTSVRSLHTRGYQKEKNPPENVDYETKMRMRDEGKSVTPIFSFDIRRGKNRFDALILLPMRERTSATRERSWEERRGKGNNIPANKWESVREIGRREWMREDFLKENEEDLGLRRLQEISSCPLFQESAVRRLNSYI